MKRVFGLDALSSAKCGAERRWIAAITSGETIAKILDHLELPNVMTQPAPPRAPAQLELGLRNVEECEDAGALKAVVGEVELVRGRWPELGVVGMLCTSI